MNVRPDVDDFDAAVITALSRVAAATHESPDLADRLLANARAGGPSVVTLSGHRRANRWTLPLLAAAAVIVLVAGGVVTGRILASDSPHHSKPPAGSTDVPRPNPSASPRPAVTAAEVENAVIDIPAWTAAGEDAARVCDAGPITFHGGKADMPSAGALGRDGYQFVGRPAIEDVNGDGANDAVVILFCGPHQPVAYRVLALEGATGGGLQIIGDVDTPVPFTTSGSGALAGYPARVAAGADGGVRVTWSDSQPGSGDGVTQLRSYRLVDGRFRQVGGPAQFPDKSADLSVTAPSTRLTKGTSGTTGTIDVTIHNAGPLRASPDLVLLVELHGVSVLDVTGPNGRVQSDQFDTHVTRVFVSALDAGADYVLHFHVRATGSTTPAPAKIDVSGGNQDDLNSDNDSTTSAFVVK